MSSIYWGFSSSEELKDTPEGGTRTLSQGCTVISWLLLSWLCIPSFPWLATVWTVWMALWNRRKIMEAGTGSYKWETGDTERLWCPGSPQGLLLSFTTTRGALIRRVWLVLGSPPQKDVARYFFQGYAFLWPPDVRSQLIGKDPDAGKDWGQEERRHEDEEEMVGWHHWLNGYEFEQTLGDDEGQGSLAYCRIVKNQTQLSN